MWPKNQNDNLWYIITINFHCSCVKIKTFVLIHWKVFSFFLCWLRGLPVTRNTEILLLLLGNNQIQDYYQSVSKTSSLHSCSHCNYVSPSLGNFKRHLLIHSGLRPYICNICSFQCNRKENLKRHFILKHFCSEWNKNYILGL